MLRRYSWNEKLVQLPSAGGYSDSWWKLIAPRPRGMRRNHVGIRVVTFSNLESFLSHHVRCFVH